MVKEKDEKKVKKMTSKQIEQEIRNLAEKGLTAEKIGEELRKQEIHTKENNIKISKILGDKYTNPDIKNIQEKLERVKRHFEKNKQDKRAMREKDRIFSQLRKVEKYSKR